MDPSKQQGKMREQMTKEQKVRLDSERKWGFIAKKDNNNFYNQTFLNKKVAEAVKNSKTQTIEEGGESYFVSTKMKAAMESCRCGRKKEGTHLIKCMQKSVIKYSDHPNGQQMGSSPTGEKEPNIPRTSNNLCGFFKQKYLNLERSTYYITPKAHLKNKITDQIYDNIILG